MIHIHNGHIRLRIVITVVGSNMKINTWRERKDDSDMCPKCRLLRQNFPMFEMEGFKILLCMQPSCGTLFVPKSEREKIDMKTLMNPLACSVCGKTCKNALGLNSHMRSHGNSP